jgi:hypothetical protein
LPIENFTLDVAFGSEREAKEEGKSFPIKLGSN